MTIKEVSQKYGITQDTLRYYERIGMIPPVTRSQGGIRDYQEMDLRWVELAKCMRSAGLPVETMITYVKLCQEGENTIGDRLKLLTGQRENLLEQRRKIDVTLERLNYKILKYEEALETGKLTWGKKGEQRMNSIFEEVKKNFGFGCMRLPMNGDQVDYEEFSKMVDTFLENGFNYFDTAHGYLGGKSEIALRECLVKRHAREEYILTNKLSTHFFTKEEEIRPLFESQLEAAGVEYFDFYLMHAQSKEIYEKYKKCCAYEVAQELQKEGKFKHFGISFHDRAEVLDQILTEHPEIEVVQIQFNYVDYEDPAVQSKLVYEVCEKHGKPVIVMEPVKGGNLVNLPEEARTVFEELNGGSPASYAIRFAAGFPNMMMVLSGMSNLEQMEDNISYMKEFRPLSEEEQAAVNQVSGIFKSMNLIPCTACRYCTDGCPRQISIPDLFSCYNAKTKYHDWNANYYYDNVHTVRNGKASDCVKCGKCEKVCPQHLKIRELLVDVAKEFEA